MSDESTICGSGAACERFCPVMRAGRECPELEEFYLETDELNLAVSAH